MRRDSELSLGERELIAAYTSGLNRCAYCHTGHTAFAASHGINPELVANLLDDLDTAPVDEKMRALLHYIRKVVIAAYSLTQSDFDRVMQAGISERGLDDAIAVASIFSFYNRLVDSHGIKPASDDDYLNRTAALFKVAGYSPVRIVLTLLGQKLTRIFR